MASVLAWADAYNTYNIQAHTYDTYNTYTCIHIHTHTCNDLGTSDTNRYIHIHTYTYNQCHEGVLGCCCCRTRLLCAAPPTQISSDRAQDGIIECPSRVEDPLAEQGGC